jgi:hypothetical protein
VVHCYRAYAVRLELASRPTGPGAVVAAGAHGWSLVYSGDTRPSAAPVHLGRGAAGNAAPLRMFPWAAAGSAPLRAAGAAAAAGCSLLIHEATFEDTAEGRANAADKRHSTVDEACAVAHAMSARHTLLTHFSALYPKLPVLKVNAMDLAAIEPLGLAGAAAAAGGAGGPSTAAGEALEAAAVADGRTLFVAYDLMTASGRDLYALPRLLPALHVLFAEEAAAEADTDAGPETGGGHDGGDEGQSETATASGRRKAVASAGATIQGGKPAATVHP